MTRNLSLIPTIEAEPEAAPPAAPPRAAPVRSPSRRSSLRVAVVPARVARAPTRVLLPHRPWRAIGIEVLAHAGILLLFAALAWPLYLWIGR